MDEHQIPGSQYDLNRAQAEGIEKQCANVPKEEKKSHSFCKEVQTHWEKKHSHFTSHWKSEDEKPEMPRETLGLFQQYVSLFPHSLSLLSLQRNSAVVNHRNMLT